MAFLSPAGEIIDAFLPTDRETGRPRGFGFITFATEDQAKACIEQFDGVELGGRRLNINRAEERGRKPRGGRGAPATEFKRGSRGDGGDFRRGSRGPGPSSAGRGDGRPPRREFRGAPPPPPVEPEYTTEDRRYQDDEDEVASGDEWGEQPSWKKKKKKAKGSRRGLRAKKRSL